MESARVQEVRELAALLEENHMRRPAALRTAVECVYGMKEDFFRHNQLYGEAKTEYEKKWETADDDFCKKHRQSECSRSTGKRKCILGG